MIMKSPYEILETVINKIILPRYSFLTLDNVDSYPFVNGRIYEIRFISDVSLDADIQMEIDTELKNIFKMTGIGEKNERTTKIVSWFKSPDDDDWSFKSKHGYNHI